MSEADTRAKLIDPTIHRRGWTEENIRREETAGAIEIINGRAKRRGKGRTDYTLRIRVDAGPQPIAVALLEAKAEHLPPDHGIEQVKAYGAAERLNVPFVFSSNGHQFVEYDHFTGVTREPRPMSEFPTPSELRERYQEGMNIDLDDPAAKPLATPYSGGEGARRYYQDAAIRAVLEHVAQGHDRALITLATGAGKTFIAVNLLKRIADAGLLKRALFVCDRDELRTQGLGAFQNVFGNDAAAASVREPQKNARIVVATYQTLDVADEDADANFLLKNYPKNYFSHIVIDECHRSAWGKWSEVFRHNPEAVQIGLTATPREVKFPKGSAEAKVDEQISADNLKHFGPAVYEYDMAQGIEDGYLAACEIVKREIFHDKAEESEAEKGIDAKDLAGKKVKDAITGEKLSPKILEGSFSAMSIEDRIQLPERVAAMCKDLFQNLLDTGGPEQKTIIFCRRDSHADAVASEMGNLYSAWCKANGKERLQNYAFKCTASVEGGDKLPDFRAGSRHHFIATTVDLLTTGVDVPAVRNVVFFKYVKSPIQFYQMVGRGTRLDPASGKMMFRVYDYTKATDLFGAAFITKFTQRTTPSKDTGGGGVGPRILRVEGFEIHIEDAGRFILTTVDGRAMPIPIEEYKAQLAKRLLAEAKTLDEFRTTWIVPAERRELVAKLPDGGRSVQVLRAVEEMEEYDLFDVLAELGYGMLPLTRMQRAEALTYKHEAWLASLPKEAVPAVTALARQFERGGIEALENAEVFNTPEVVKAGGIKALKSAGKPADVLKETKEKVLAA